MCEDTTSHCSRFLYEIKLNYISRFSRIKTNTENLKEISTT